MSRAKSLPSAISDSAPTRSPASGDGETAPLEVAETPPGPEFFLVCAPGLEDQTERELDIWAAGYERRRERGGVTLFAPLEVGFALNRYLKTPNRILVRIAKFGARDFPKLFKKISNFPWEEWVADDVRLEFEAATHGSRLKMKKRIEETCLDGRKARLKKRAVSTASVGAARPTLDVLIRFNEDVATMSLDTSGEILHKRGSRGLAAEAPLRETIAAALLMRLEGLAPVTADSIEIVDPMTGGGTFLLEAAQLAAPNAGRVYAFERFENGTSATLAPAKLQPTFAKFIGFDLDSKALDAARGNLRGVRPDAIDLRQEDFFTAEPLAAGGERWLIVNPPYGERLKVEGKLGDFYQKLMFEAERVAKPARACFIFPEKANPDRLKQPAAWKRAESRRFSNGGLPVVAVFFLRKEKTK